jgi:2'-5' RNA ligase
MRLFVGLSIPPTVAQSLMLLQGGVPGARWQDRAQLHLTLRFIGEVESRDVDMIDDLLAGIMAPDFTLQLHGVGQFGGSQAHSLWAGVRPNPALDHLARKVDSAIRRVGQPPSSREGDAHAFKPHVTMARMRRPDNDKVVEWLAYHALYTSAEFVVDSFQLFSSRLTGDGSIYTVEEDYPIGGHDDEIGD